MLLIVPALLTASVLLPFSASAEPLPLQGRTLNGAAVAANDPSAAFEYDPNLNITWLRDWNSAPQMNFETARAFAASLTIGGMGGWRLPFVRDTGPRGCNFSNAGGTDCGYNVQTLSGGVVYSELAYLWYAELGNLAFCAPGEATCTRGQPGWGLEHTGDFIGMQSAVYWSGTQFFYANGVSLQSWAFSTTAGYQNVYDIAGRSPFIAVRDGDVAAIPEPAAAWQWLAGAAFAVLLRRRHPRLGPAPAWVRRRRLQLSKVSATAASLADAGRATRASICSAR